LEACDVKVVHHDGDPAVALPAGPFDILVCEGAVVRAPEAWLAVLALGGRAALIERNGPAGRAIVHVRTPEAIGRRTGFDSAPPYLPGFEPQAGFAF